MLRQNNSLMQAMEDNKLFFVGLKAFIAKDGKLLILREFASEKYPSGKKWEIPGGRITESEERTPLIDVLLREVREECGSIEIIVGEVFHVFRRQFPNGEWVFLAGFDCSYISGEVTLSHEHTEYAWIIEADMEHYDFVNGYEEAIRAYFRKKSFL